MNTMRHHHSILKVFISAREKFLLMFMPKHKKSHPHYESDFIELCAINFAQQKTTPNGAAFLLS